MAKPDAIPKAVLNKAVCVLVFPMVRKVGVGIGVTYGFGVLVCRSGANMAGAWSAPAMYRLNVGLRPQDTLVFQPDRVLAAARAD